MVVVVVVVVVVVDVVTVVSSVIVVVALAGSFHVGITPEKSTNRVLNLLFLTANGLRDVEGCPYMRSQKQFDILYPFFMIFIAKK